MSEEAKPTSGDLHGDIPVLWRGGFDSVRPVSRLCRRDLQRHIWARDELRRPGGDCPDACLVPEEILRPGDVRSYDWNSVR